MNRGCDLNLEIASIKHKMHVVVLITCTGNPLIACEVRKGSKTSIIGTLISLMLIIGVKVFYYFSLHVNSKDQINSSKI